MLRESERENLMLKEIEASVLLLLIHVQREPGFPLEWVKEMKLKVTHLFSSSFPLKQVLNTNVAVKWCMTNHLGMK